MNETPLALALGLPRDGGFGQIPTVFGSFGNTDDLPPPFGHLEFEEFNSPPVVESADTGPFFHNHTVKDLESAVAFYGTPAFKNSLAANVAIPVNISADPNDPEVQAIAAFLRVLNALENIRSSINVAERGRTMTSVADLRELARLSLAETVDAMEVLSEGALATTQSSLPFGPPGSNCSPPGWRSRWRSTCRFGGRSTTCWMWPSNSCVRRGRPWPIRPPCRRRSAIERVALVHDTVAWGAIAV